VDWKRNYGKTSKVEQFYVTQPQSQVDVVRLIHKAPIYRFWL